MSKPKVYVTRLIPEVGLAKIKEHCNAEVWQGDTPPPRAVLLEKVKGIDGFLPLLTDPIDAEMMDAAGTQLKVISNYAVGYDNIDVNAATARGIMVCNTPGVLTDTTADFAFTLLMTAARRVVEAMEHVRAGKWKTWGPRTLLGQDITGATLGIIGMGRIGRGMAKRAQGFDMRVLYYDCNRVPDGVDTYDATCADLDTIFAEADFISVHVPLTSETEHMINRAALRKMKKTAVLINTARGPVVDPDALYDALNEGDIAYAALDVTEPEPLPADYKLLTLPNIIIAPHIASASVATRDKMAMIAAENLLAGLRRERPPHIVNPEVLD